MAPLTGGAMLLHFSECLDFDQGKTGLAAHYASWRAMQWGLFVWGVLIFAAMALWFPETSHPGTRGIDKLVQSSDGERRWKWVWLNPLSSLTLLRSPNLMLVVSYTLSFPFYPCS